jgi:hypothetical protein
VGFAGNLSAELVAVEVEDARANDDYEDATMRCRWTLRVDKLPSHHEHEHNIHVLDCSFARARRSVRWFGGELYCEDCSFEGKRQHE